MITQSQAKAIIAAELRLHPHSADLYKLMGALAESAENCIKSGNHPQLHSHIQTANDLYMQGDKNTKDLVANIFVFQLDHHIVKDGFRDSNLLDTMAPRLRAEVARHINSSGL